MRVVEATTVAVKARPVAEVVSAQEPKSTIPMSASGLGPCANLTSVRSTHAPRDCTGRGWFRACEKMTLR
jgi:hypothetical protein